MLPDAKSKTITQLRAELIPTKRDALIQINGSDKVPGKSVKKYRKDGQIELQSDEICDIETDEVISTREITWTYYEKEPGAPVDEITIVEKDDRDKEISRKTIKHYPDGRQPEVV